MMFFDLVLEEPGQKGLMSVQNILKLIRYFYLQFLSVFLMDPDFPDRIRTFLADPDPDFPDTDKRTRIRNNEIIIILLTFVKLIWTSSMFFVFSSSF